MEVPGSIEPKHTAQSLIGSVIFVDGNFLNAAKSAINRFYFKIIIDNPLKFLLLSIETKKIGFFSKFYIFELDMKL